MYTCYWDHDPDVMCRKTISVSVEQAMNDFVINGTYWVKESKGRQKLENTWLVEYDTKTKTHVIQKNEGNENYIEDYEWVEYLKNPRVFPTNRITCDFQKQAGDHALKVKEIWDEEMTNINDGLGVACAYQHCVDYVVSQEISPPSLDKRSFLSLNNEAFSKGFHSNIKRMCSTKWWDSRLAKKRYRDNELKRIKDGKVTKYVSSIALDNFLSRTKKSEDYMNSWHPSYRV